MTYGRPSMTSHISPVSLPEMRPNSQAEDPCELSGQPCDHKLGYMTFYVSTIQLYNILESILSDIYNAWQSKSTHHRSMSLRGIRHRSLDVIMELDDKLSAYEAGIPSFLNWMNEPPTSSPEGHSQQSIFKRQQNVLRARYAANILSFLYSGPLNSLDSFTSASSSSAPCSHSSAPRNALAQHDPPSQPVPYPRKTKSTPPCP